MALASPETVSPPPEGKKSAILEGSPVTTAAVVTLLTVGGFILRRQGLNPSSFFLDDAWVALVHRVGWNDFATVDFTTTGFAAGLKAWLDVVGFSSLRAQFPIFLAALALPAATFLVLRSRVNWYWAAMAGAFLALSPGHAEYSVRIKQYSLEALFTLLVLHFAWQIIEAPHTRRHWVRLALTSAVALITSFATVFAIIPACAAAVLALLRSSESGISPKSLLDPAIRPMLVPMFLLGVGTAVWFLLILRPNLNDALSNFWAANYIPTDEGLGEAFSTLVALSSDAFEGFLPLPGLVVALLLSVAVLSLLVRKFELLLALSGPYLALVVASALEVAPLGGVRTDIFIYPALAMLIATGFHELQSILAAGIQAAEIPLSYASVLLAVAAIGVAAQPADASVSAYPVEDLAPLVDELDRQWQDGDILVLYYAAVFHYALYADVEFEVSEGSPPFEVTLLTDDLVRLRAHRNNPELYQSFLETADQGSERVWFLVAHPCRCDVPQINEMIQNLGRSPTFDSQLQGASLTLWERP